MASIGELSGTLSIDATQGIASLNKITGLLTAGLGIAGIGLTLAGLKNLGETAERAGDLAQGMSRNFGDVTGTMSTLRGAVQGAVSDMDLMKGANEMATKGISTNATQIGGVWQTAQIRAKELGTTTTEEFGNIEAAILRPAMLKRLYSDVPEALTKVGTGMSQTAQRAEALNFVLNRGSLAAEQYSKAGIAIADPWEQFDATMQNVKQTLAISIGPLLNDVGKLIAMVARSISAFVDSNKGAIEGVLKFGQAVVVVIANLLGLNSTLSDVNKSNNGLTDYNLKGYADGAIKASDSVDQLADSVKKLNNEIELENYSFNKSLSDIIAKRQDAIDTNKAQLDQQTEDFNKSQADSKKTETQKTAEMKKALNQRIADLQTTMANTLVIGSESYEADLAKYKEIIKKEKEEGEQKILDQQQIFQEETDSAQKKFDEQTSALRKSIKDDEDFLAKHAEDMKLINQGMILDEIDELKKGHEQKLKDLQDANAAQVASMKGLSSDVGKIFANMPKLDFNSLITWPKVTDASKIIEDGLKTLAANIVRGFMGVTGVLMAGVGDVMYSIAKFILDKLGVKQILGMDTTKFLNLAETSTMNEIGKLNASGISSALNTLGLKGYASGTTYAPGGMSIVGENGPELVNLPRGSQVIPNNEINDYSGKTVTINNFIQKGFDVDAFNNRLSSQLRTY